MRKCSSQLTTKTHVDFLNNQSNKLFHFKPLFILQTNMTRCPFALTTTCLLAAISVVIMSAGKNEDVNSKVHWFLNHHVKNKHVRAVIEFATVQGGVYYGTIVMLAHVIGYLVAVNFFDISHAVAGKSLGIVMGVVGVVGLGGAIMMMTTTSTSRDGAKSTRGESGSVKRQPL